MPTAIPRQPGVYPDDPELTAVIQAQQQYDATGVMPPGYGLVPGSNNIAPLGELNTFWDKHGWELMGGLAGGGTLAGMALGAPLIGAASGATAVPSVSGVTTGLSGTGLAGASGAGVGAGVGATGSTGALGILTKLKAAGIDPTVLGLGALGAALGSNQHVQGSFHKNVSPEAAQLVDPIQSLYNSINASNNLGVSLNNTLRNGFDLPAAVAPPKPISIPGLNFQIGGGLGTDPAALDPSMLHFGSTGDFYTSALPKGDVNMPAGSAPVPVQRRHP